MATTSEDGVTCEHCAAVCCREEVLCIADGDIPERFIERAADGSETMRRLDDGWCAALNRADMRCGIYAERPLPCRELDMGGVDCLRLRARFAVEFS